MCGRVVRWLVVTMLWFAVAFPAAAQDGTLIVAGKIPAGELILTREELLTLPQHELTEQPMSFPTASTFRGPRLADVMTLAGAAAGDMTLVALDEYKTTISAAEMAAYDPILALDMDGVALAGHDFGPYFVMWPFKERPEIDNDTFHAKAIWQVVKIEVQ